VIQQFEESKRLEVALRGNLKGRGRKETCKCLYLVL